MGLIDVGMRVTKTVSFTLLPGFILAGDIRNDVYVTLERGEFEKGNETNGEAVFWVACISTEFNINLIYCNESGDV